MFRCTYFDLCAALRSGDQLNMKQGTVSHIVHIMRIGVEGTPGQTGLLVSVRHRDGLTQEMYWHEFKDSVVFLRA